VTVPLLRIRDLKVTFDNGAGPRLAAVDGLCLSVFPGQTLAVVGESGCGKSVSAMSILQLLPSPPARYDAGAIEFTRDDETIDLLRLDQQELRSIRGGEIAMIFQEPMTCLNPVYTVGDQITEAIGLHQQVKPREARAIAIQAMRDVGIPSPEKRLSAYPHQFSGGMRQRVMIAMALACRPCLLLADEPTTALDVTIQAQILELLHELQRHHSMGLILITHDHGVVAEHAHVVCVMYAGRVVEYAHADEVFARPMHPYTRGLLASIPRLGTRRERLTTITEVTGDQAAFDLGGCRAWWPWHERPDGVVVADSPAADSTLAQLGDGHWVALWRTKEALALPTGDPIVAPMCVPT
jgi:ABC-type dipeptide/oligopeptide/nickel transport system ATPase component